ncbi:hypothetical protein [Companilactobacillus sp.]|jgi:hypothetical protein|uniref:hypothetical protein n=1 Tax=Companilactobacillus sp. TaxID=2767905 RepID=UPI0025BF51A8|nr:hypothetical protein [Companilactobacillus sp.]MCH4008162.1 hypothetical protein [Companilactobacillus sp.]MCH4051659.1 hypothetical protein [Companilactobacillus sp.]MCH4076105.1 hypothetical protein [Companilactobacillus sp.]MCH4124680.1 hypothetical protein [Companilactobacillus sp.]MCH4131222.1 hypothetical protein [Companilactobacillus sp.]
MITITFVNNQTLSLNNDTIIHAYKHDNTVDTISGEPNGYLETGYLSQFFEGSINSKELDSSVQQIGVAGLLAEADYFRLDDQQVFYKTTSILSIS